MRHLSSFVVAFVCLSIGGSARRVDSARLKSASRVDGEGGWDLAESADALAARFSFDALVERFHFERAWRKWHVDTPLMLETPLVAAKFCKASYGDRSVVEKAVESAGFSLRAHTDQWWIAGRPNGEVFVVFRGTADFKDVIADIQVRPTLYNGAMWHSGFLKGAQDAHLQHALRQHANSYKVTVVGHSLGGAIAYTLAASGLMPVGRIQEVITFGAPAAIFGSSSDRVRRNFQHTAFVHESDPVPRLLGSAAKNLEHFFQGYQEQSDPSVIESLSHYQQQGDVTWLKNGRPLQVPENKKALVMQLQMSLNLFNPFANPVADHSMEGYRGDIQEAFDSGSNL